MLSSVFLRLGQQVLNQYLSLDAETQARLSALRSQVIRIEIAPAQFVFFLKIAGRQIHLLSDYTAPIDAAVKATPAVFLKTLMQSGQDSLSLPDGMELTGNVHLLQTLQQIFRNMDIDWEEHLAGLTGDLFAHQFCRIGRGLENRIMATWKTLTQNIQEYLQEEVDLLPSPMALEDFCDDVDVLREDVERFALRIAKLQR